MPLSFSPPIVKVTPDAAATLAGRLKTTILGYKGRTVDDMYDDDEGNTYAYVEICDDIVKLAREKTYNYDYYAYLVSGGEPVALLAIDAFPALGDRFLWIECVVAHPGTALGGLTMVEHTVRLSAAAGLGGVVRLGAAYDSAQSFYASLGFRNTGKMLEEDTGEDQPYRYPEMELKPATRPGEWKRVRGQWCALKVAGQNYYA